MLNARQREISDQLFSMIAGVGIGRYHLPDDHWVGNFDQITGVARPAIDEAIGLERRFYGDSDEWAIDHD